MDDIIRLSRLSSTWILDLDGTIVKHNGYKIDGKDSFLENAEAFLKSIPENDMIVFITSRGLELKERTESFLSENGVRYDGIIYNAPLGARILVNDKKPSGLKTAFAINTERDNFPKLKIEIDESL